MRVVQTTFGVFHQFELARELFRRGLLQQIYSTFPWRRLAREALPRGLVTTFPWLHTPEMVLRRFRVEPKWLLDPIGYSNAVLLDRFVAQRLRDGREAVPDVLVGLSGSSLDAGRVVQERGGRFVCDRGSSHQRYQEKLVREEFRRWQVSLSVGYPRDTEREERIYEQADAITVPSSFAAQSFVEQGVPKEKMHILPYGVLLQKFRKTGEPSRDRFEVLFAGSVGLRKGIPYLLQAFASLPVSRRRLRLAGPVQREIVELLQRLPTEAVEFMGPVPQSRLIELMSESHVMVLPSIEEGFGMVLGQAMACGCPVIASLNTGGPDLIEDGKEGFLIPIRDVPTLQDRMQQLADDPALQQRMGEAALRRVRSIGGWADYGDRWEALLNQLTGSA